MKVLRFNLSEIQPLVDHAAKAKIHTPTFAQRYEEVEGQFVEKKKLEVSPGLILVKDQGTYLLSNGALKEGETASNLGLISYAEGTNPKTDPDWWDVSRELCGGDDFAEYLPLEWFSEALEQGDQYLELLMTDDSIEMSLA